MNIRIKEPKSKSILITLLLVLSGFLICIPNTPLTESAEALSEWYQASYEDFINGSFDNLSINGSGLETELRLENCAIEWRKIDIPNSPPSRYLHDMATVWGTDKVVLFGGFYPHANDTWIFDGKNKKWTRKWPIKHPTNRSYHAMASIWGTDKVILFGGTDNNGKLNDTWIYYFNFDIWEKKLPQPNPTARIGHAMAPVWGTDKIVLFGGYFKGSQMLQDTWIYDFKNNTWTEKILVNKPKARVYHSMVPLWGTDKVILYAGCDAYDAGNSLDEDIWIYDLSDNKWTNRSTEIELNASYFQSMSNVWGTDKIVLFGGQKMIKPLNKTWIYDFGNNTWTEKKYHINPDVRQASAMASIHGTDKVVLFGGFGAVTTFFNDTWIFKLNQGKYYQNGSYISDGYDTYSNSSFKTINWNANIPNNTSIKFQLRTANTEANLKSKSFVGPNGNASKYYDSSPSTIWNGHYRDRWIQYRVYFNSTNATRTPCLKNILIKYNCLPETFLFGPENGSIISNNKPKFIWNFTDFDSVQQAGFQVIIDDENTFNNVDYDSKEQISANQYWQFPSGTNYNVIADGVWYWKVRTKDVDGDWSEYSNSRIITIDTKLPSSEIEAPLNNGFYYKLDSISGTAADTINGSGLDKVEISINRLNDDNHWNGSNWESNEQWLPVIGTIKWKYDIQSEIWNSSMTYVITSRAIDNASNIEIPNSGIKFLFDPDKPFSIVDVPLVDSYLNDLNMISGQAFDTGGSNLKQVEISIIQSGNKYFWDGSSWSTSETWLLTSGTEKWSYNSSQIIWSSGTQYIIKSRAVDIANNFEIPNVGTRFYIEMDKPASTINSILNNSYLNTLLSISGTAFDVGGSGVNDVKICIQRASDKYYWSGSNWGIKKHWLDAIGTTSWYYNASNVMWVSDTLYNIRSRSSDIAGNIEDPGFGINFVFDNRPPENLSILINNGDEYAGSTSVTLSLHSVDPSAGVDKMSFSADGTVWSNWEEYRGAKQFTLPAGDGNKTVYFIVSDRIGNIAEPVIDHIILDTTPPENLFIEINSNNDYTNSQEVILTLNAIDATSGLNEMSFNVDANTWTVWEPFNTQKSMTILSGDGEKIIYFRVSDKVGNIATASDTIILDTMPPDSLWISINDGAAKTNSTTVELSLYAIDETSGVYQISFSFDGNVWSQWEYYTDERSYLLTDGNGVKIIYFRVIDHAGNIAEPVNDEILLVTTPPDVEDDDLLEHKQPDKKEFYLLLFILLLIVVIIITLIAVKIFHKKRKKEVPEQKDKVVDPIITATQSSNQPSVSTTISTVEHPKPVMEGSTQPTITKLPQPIPKPKPIPIISPRPKLLLPTTSLTPQQNNEESTGNTEDTLQVSTQKS
ncbi:MAG: hypothetical protein JSV49_03865 [Thermoplasmata archaeon]|nr:MAG: hypothetical protein JSV49_03865 [Thermoplasmata archaeon]